MNRWVVVGFYHRMGSTFGAYWGPLSEMTALQALRASIEWAHFKSSPEQQITVCGVISGNGGLIHDFGMVRSDDPSTWPEGMQKEGGKPWGEWPGESPLK